MPDHHDPMTCDRWLCGPCRGLERQKTVNRKAHDRYETAVHVALLDPIAGAGVLAKPTDATDVTMPGGPSLHQADWDAMIGRLVTAGWLPLVDQWDLPTVLATLPDGREVHGLYPALDDAMPWTPEWDTNLRTSVLALLPAI